MSASRLFFVTFLTSFCAIAYEMLIVQAVSMTVSKIILVQTITLGVYLAAVGIGAFLSRYIKEKNAMQALGYIEMALTLFGLFSVVFVFLIYCLVKLRFHNIFGDLYLSVAQSQITFCISSQFVSFILGLLIGFELPLIMKLSPQTQITKILFLNYLGAVLGAVSIVFVFLPFLDVLGSAIVLSLITVFAAFLILNSSKRKRISTALFMLGSISLIYVSSTYASQFYQFYLKTRYSVDIHFNSILDVVRFSPQVMQRELNVIRKKTHYQYVDFAFHKYLKNYSFYLDGQIQLSPSWADEYHESLVHLPIQFHKKIPKRALILGGGDGGAAAELLKYGSRIDEIYLIELDPDIIAMAKEEAFFKKVNHGSLNHPKVKIHTSDAIAFLRTTSLKFDAVFVDFPLPHDYDILKLYSIEFFKMLLSHLEDSGFVSLDAGVVFMDSAVKERPSVERIRNWNQTVLSTLYEAGLHDIITYSSSEGFIVARREKVGSTNWEMADFGIKYKTLKNRSLKTYLATDLEVKIDPRAANSIFKPKLFEYPEARF